MATEALAPSHVRAPWLRPTSCTRLLGVVAGRAEVPALRGRERQRDAGEHVAGRPALRRRVLDRDHPGGPCATRSPAKNSARA